MNLQGNFLAQTDDVLAHRTLTAIVEVLLFSLNEIVDAIERHTAIIAHDASTSVRIGESCKDMVMAHALHLFSVSIKHAIIVRAAVFRKDFMELVGRLVAIGSASLFRHLDATVWHEGTLQRFVGLQTHNLLKVFGLWVDVSSRISRHATHNFGFHVEHSAFFALSLLQELKFRPKDVGSLRRTLKKSLVPFVRGIIILDELPHVDFIGPFGSFEPSPCFFHN